LDDQEEEDKSELDKKGAHGEEAAEEINSVLEESMYETEFFDFEDEQEIQEQGLEQNHEQEQEQNQSEIFLEEVEEEEPVVVDYMEIQMQIILSDPDKKLKWEEYKKYVDENVLVGLQDATICRYNIYIILIPNKYLPKKSIIFGHPIGIVFRLISPQNIKVLFPSS